MRIFVKRLVLILFVSAIACSNQVSTGEKITDALGIKDNTESPFYFDRSEYPGSGSDDYRALPIGVFDSGTGGLTVLEQIYANDTFENGSGTFIEEGDGIPDYAREDFVYLGDMANMPYGNYPSENGIGFLEELCAKDALFLLNDYYHISKDSPERGKKPNVKIIVIACNTGTAYGKTVIEEMIDYLGLDVDVIGVVGAGAKGAVENIGKSQDGAIGVMATVGTVLSESYPNAIRTELAAQGKTGIVDILQQGSLGIAESIDNDPDYIDRELKTLGLRTGYKGPSVSNGDNTIRKEFLELYNFVTDGNEMLVEEKNGEITDIQLNSVMNYVRYHVTELLLNMKDGGIGGPLRNIVLGCTHYPYVEDEITAHLDYLRDYTDDNGNKPFAGLLSEDVVLIDPAKLTAREAYTALAIRNALRASGGSRSSFYISMPNKELPGVRIIGDNRFEYDYKYGRLPFYAENTTGSLPVEYVLRIPMTLSTLNSASVEQIRIRLPITFSAMQSYSH